MCVCGLADCECRTTETSALPNLLQCFGAHSFRVGHMKKQENVENFEVDKTGSEFVTWPFHWVDGWERVVG